MQKRKTQLLEYRTSFRNCSRHDHQNEIGRIISTVLPLNLDHKMHVQDLSQTLARNTVKAKHIEG